MLDWLRVSEFTLQTQGLMVVLPGLGFALVQVRKLLIALQEQNLPLTQRAVQHLLRQLMYHVGPMTDGELEWKKDIHNLMSEFVEVRSNPIQLIFLNFVLFLKKSSTNRFVSLSLVLSKLFFSFPALSAEAKQLFLPQVLRSSVEDFIVKPRAHEALPLLADVVNYFLQWDDLVSSPLLSSCRELSTTALNWAKELGGFPMDFRSQILGNARRRSLEKLGTRLHKRLMIFGI